MDGYHATTSFDHEASLLYDAEDAARATVSLDALCDPEFAFGEETDLRRRGDMLDEGIRVTRAAWSGEPVHFAGQHYRRDMVVA